MKNKKKFWLAALKIFLIILAAILVNYLIFTWGRVKL